jgi:hypothetical protein
MEYPCLRVKAHRRRVVRHFDLSPKRRQFVKGALFGAVCVSGGEDPKRLSELAMTTQRIKQRQHACPSNERDDDVDLVSRRNLCFKFMTHGRLARRIRQDGRIEKRRQWLLDQLWLAVRQ